MAEEQKHGGKMRLDQLLVERGLYPSRSRARDAILRGTVREAGGRELAKPGQEVGHNIRIEISDPASAYVSRAALKLTAGLDHFKLNPAGCRCLDIGASTGGFTQVLLERGAQSVIAIDAGHGQIHETLKSDARVTSFEGLNARDISSEIFAEGAPDFLVCDVSFISLRLALPKALELAALGAAGVFLVKPQFEAGKAAIGKNGILKDETLGPKIAAGMADWLEGLRWRSLGFIASPLEGGDGNREYLLAGRKGS